MSTKSDRYFRYLMQLFIFIAVLGLIVLIVSNYGKDPSDIAFSLIAFIVSVAALVMTTLQNRTIAKQSRITERAARIVHEGSEQIEEMVKEERIVEREIRKDIAMDQEIMGILEEYGIGDNKDEREKVASKIAAKVHQKATKK